MSDMRECAKCHKKFDVSDLAGLVKIGINRGDGAGPQYYCCATEEEAWAMFRDFERHVIAGEPEEEQ